MIDLSRNKIRCIAIKSCMEQCLAWHFSNFAVVLQVKSRKTYFLSDYHVFMTLPSNRYLLTRQNEQAQKSQLRGISMVGLEKYSHRLQREYCVTFFCQIVLHYNHRWPIIITWNRYFLVIFFAFSRIFHGNFKEDARFIVSRSIWN